MSFAQFLIATALPTLIGLQSVSALPTHGEIVDRQCTGCTPPPSHYGQVYCPIIDGSEDVTGEVWQAGNSALSGSALAVGQTYTQGSSWTIGASLGLSFEKVVGASAGLSLEVTQSVEVSVTTTNEDTCPEGGEFACGLHVYPGMKKVWGHMEARANGEVCAGGDGYESGDFEMVVPRKDSSNNGFYTTRLCGCGNLKDAGNPAMPQELCKENCVNPGTMKFLA